MMRTEKTEKKAIATIALGYDGIVIYDIEYGVDDYIIFRWEIGGEKGRLSRAKVHYAKRPYFKSFGHRYHLDEALRTNL